MFQRYSLLLGTGASLCLLNPVAVLAQDGAGQDNPSDTDEILVQGDRLRGQLNVSQAPILELNEADIAAVGATSVADLLTAIAPQTGSARGRGGGGQPVILVNGLRIGSFRELRSYPPEAIAKVEVLPEEVAQQFGFAPDQRVVNVILKERFSSREIEVEAGAPDRGDYFTNEQEFTWLRIRNGARINTNVEIRDTSLLTEGERGVIQTSAVSDLATDPDPATYRSLLPGQFEFEASVNWARALLESGTTLSFNTTYERSEALNLSGLNSVILTAPDGSTAERVFGADTPLERRNSRDSIASSASFGRSLGAFQLTVTADAGLAENEDLVDRRFDTSDLREAALAGTLALDGDLPSDVDNGFDTAHTRTWNASSKATLRGVATDLPAGELSTTFDFGYAWNRIEASDTRGDTQTMLTRGDLEAGLNVVLPIASRREGVWDALGSVNLSGQAGINHLSDFGTLYDWSLGLAWSPWDSLDLQVSRIGRDVAPSLGALGNPQTLNLNVPVFDFVTGETVLATVTLGGNPDLLAEKQRDWKFSANWKLPFLKDTRISADYVRNRSRDVTSGFPALAEAIELAFPDRITRDGTGRLIALDARSVTFDRVSTERLVLGLVTTGSFGTPAPVRGGPPGSGAGAGPGGGTGGGPRPSGLPFGGRDGQGRYFFNLSHSIELNNEVLIAPGVPLLDLLDGDSTSTNGLPRHGTTIEAGLFRDGMGLRLSGRYVGKTRIDGSGVGDSVFFGDLATLDLRLFTDLGRLFKQETGALKNLRLSLEFDNLFDGQRRIVDANGDVPLRYQPFLVDPLGRVIGLELRKMF
ncbi:MAG: TonB-dependent receptor [Erythrobacter sp.]|nr:TonB-dependent receptor [Erythrobacter sp.]